MTRVSQNRISVFLAVRFAVSLLLVDVVNAASIYWTDERGVHHSDLDGQNPRTIVPIPITSIASMAIDEIDNKIYYADFYGKRILRSNLDGTELENVITSGLWAPTNIVVDSSRRKVYWIDQFEIYRANLDGTDIEMLLESYEPFDLAIDEQAGKIYWLFYYPKDPTMLGQANLDGTDIKTVIVWDRALGLSCPSANTIAIDADAQKIYFTINSCPWEKSTIQRANMDGTDIEVVLELERNDFSRGIAVDPKSGKVFWSEPNMGTLYRANLDGSDVEIIVQQNRVGAMTLHRGNAKVYWANSWEDITVHRANFDGSGHEVVWQTSPRQFFGIDLDKSRGHIYWASVNRLGSEKRGEILRANLDGTVVESLIAKGIEHLAGIAVDERGEKIYWVDAYWATNKNKKISRANLDGSNPEDLVIDGFVMGRDIEVDTESGKIYWVNLRQGLHRANLDGTVVEVLIGNLVGIRGIGIDQIGEKIYWTQDKGFENTIQVANLNGMNQKTLVTVDRGGWWHDIDLDNTNQKMYWVDQPKGLIQRANLDGSDVEIVLSDLATPKYIALDLTPESVVDVNQDGIVNIQDLVLVASQFGQLGQNRADINHDRVVNILDLVLVAAAFENVVVAPPVKPQVLETLAPADIQQWLADAKALGETDSRLNGGIIVLEQLLVALSERSSIPLETSLQPNYPNPFNPETWIPYQLPEAAEVTMKIYDANGLMVRELVFGHQPAGIYQSRSRAAYWDGRNQQGEPVVSGIYFCTLRAGDFATTQKMSLSK